MRKIFFSTEASQLFSHKCNTSVETKQSNDLWWSEYMFCLSMRLTQVINDTEMIVTNIFLGRNQSKTTKLDFLLGRNVPPLILASNT